MYIFGNYSAIKPSLITL